MSTTIRVNSEIKEQVTPILNTLGLSVGEAVNLFLHQVKLHNGIPFDLIVREPSPEFWADVEEAHKAVENGTAVFYKTTDEFMKALEAL
ncbi:MAG: type II toxin-antitoxin system RelB/DinJ family antitoxin [Oscillospiraceae bacterium]|nr:type II toxin-antitoxin system RelB/DinJ family antitoxin [Oscillospiraceae bacterium]